MSEPQTPEPRQRLLALQRTTRAVAILSEVFQSVAESYSLEEQAWVWAFLGEHARIIADTNFALLREAMEGESS